MTTFTIISAIICLIIVFLIILNMYEPVHGYNCDKHYERIKVPLYVYIIAIIVCVIPILNIMLTTGYIIFCICECCEDDMIIKGPMGKIGKFLNKQL